jgi:hypothetical protein
LTPISLKYLPNEFLFPALLLGSAEDHEYPDFVPNSLYLDLNTNNHDFEFGMPAVAFSGTYEDTSSGYLMLPNLPFSLLVIPKLPITKTDKTHLNIIGLKFKESGPNQPGVTTFVPDRG